MAPELQGHHADLNAIRVLTELLGLPPPQSALVGLRARALENADLPTAIDMIVG